MTFPLRLDAGADHIASIDMLVLSYIGPRANVLEPALTSPTLPRGEITSDNDPGYGRENAHFPTSTSFLGLATGPSEPGPPPLPPTLYLLPA